MAASLLLLLVSACTAELGFKHKRQYTYLYEAKQASGIPGLKSQWSAFGMKMKVVIQVPTIDNLYFKLENIQEGELQNVHTQQPWRRSFTMQYSPIQQYQAELGKVFKVELNGGVIRKVTTTQQEPIWVVNIKKSIAQMFQLDMQKHQAIDMPITAQPSGYQSGQQAEFFRVMEDSIGGECETLYETTPRLPQDIKADMLQELTILSRTSAPGIKVPQFDQFHPFIVTKSKNYQNCRSRPNWQHMTPGAVSCRSDDCYLTASNRSASARYVLDGDRGSYQIQSVLAESEALMFPYGHETEQLWTVTNQTLFLQKESSMDSFYGDPQQPKSHEKLAFQYPTADGEKLKMPDLKSAPQLSVHIPGAPVKLIQSQLPTTQLMTTIKNVIQQVDQTLNHVPEPVQEDVTGYVVEIERALSLMSYDQLSQVYNKLTTEGEKEIFWDTLTLTGTNPAVMKILDAIHTGQIDESRKSSILAALPISIKTPTYQLIERLFQLFKSDVIQMQKSTRMTMALSLGNIFYQVCVSNTTVQHSYTQGLYQQPFCDSRTIGLLKQQFIPFLEDKIEHTQEPEKLAYIQALANTGDQQIMAVLRKLVTKQNSPLVASKAIYAFYRVIAQYPEKVRKIMSPTFHDLSRSNDVRLAAVTMLLATNPPIAYWQKVATSTWYEPSNAVADFIHSTYDSFANITMAQVQPLFEMSRRARITLPLIREPQGGFGFSGSYKYRNAQVIPQYQVAALTQLSVIPSKTSVIPSVLYVEFQNYINSILYSNYRWSLNVQGGQKIIDSIMGVGNSVYRGRQSPRDIRTGYQKLENYLSSLTVHQPELETFQAALYKQALGAVDAFFVFDENSLRERGEWSKNQLQKIAYLEDTTVTFASEIGMPVIYSKKMPMVASSRGQMKIGWSMKDGEYHVTMKDVQPFVAVKSLVTVTTVSPFSLRALGAGVENKAQVSMPLSLTAKLDLQAKKVQVEVEAISQPSLVKVAHIRTFPFTTAMKVTKFDNLVRSSDTKEITTSEKTEVKVSFGKDLGLEGYLRMASDNPIMNFGTFWTEVKKRGPAGIANFWFMMGSLRSRHYDIGIDTTSSRFQKLQTTFALVLPDKQDTEIRQPIVSNQQHTSQLRSSIQSILQLMRQQQQRQTPLVPQQQRLPLRSKIGYVAVATITEKSRNMLHYNTHLTLASDPMWYTQKMSFKAASPSKKVCLDAEMAFPKLSDIRQHLLETEVKAPLWAKLGYGQTCQEHSLDMHGYVRRDELAKQYAKSCPMALRCIQHERVGNPNSADCRLAKDHAALANYYDFELTGNNVTPNFLRTAYGLENFVKYILWPYMNDDPLAQNPSNKVSIKMQLNPNINGLSLHLFKPFGTTKFNNIELPFDMLFEPGLMTMRKSIQKKMVDSLYGVDKTVCVIDKRAVNTFDNVTLTRSPSECWTLMAADSSLTRKVAIWERQVNQRSAVRVLLDDTVVEIDSNNLHQVQVNRETKPLSPTKHIVVRDPAGHKNLTEILMLAEDTVKVVMPEHYVELLVTSEGLQIRASLLAYRNRMRGVCGDFDGEQQYDLVGPTSCIYHKGQEFYEAYRMPQEGSLRCQSRRPLRCIRRPPQARQSQRYHWGVQRY